MKKFLIIAALILSVCSCSEWLEATSSTQYKVDEIYSSREGFHDALSGVYINMGNTSLYGMDVTWKVNDLVCYPYNTFTTQSFSDLQQHNYSSTYARSVMEPIWQAFYNVIANINIILENIDSRKEVFATESEYNWVKGELLGLRAYLHFDLLRLYGLPWSDDMQDKLTIPYVTVYGKDVTPQKSYRETFEMLLGDLNQAIALLADDPITGVYPNNFATTINSEGYWSNRTKHLNLYAAKMLLARVYAWKGDLDSAASLATEIIKAATSTKAVSFINPEEVVASSLQESQRDWVFSTEHIFTLEVTGLYNYTMGYLIPGSGNSSGGYYINLDAIDGYLYNTSSGDNLAAMEDIRGKAFLLQYSGNAYICYKLYGSASSTYRNMMPMMKLPELYYMIAESAIKKGDDTKAREALDVVRHYRGITEDLPETAVLQRTLTDEYIKEFINEGQLFYYLKRNLSTGISTTDYKLPGLAAKDLIYPYPEDEVNYGRVQEK